MSNDHNAKVTCTYCGYSWTERRYSATLGSAEKCFKCNDKNLVIVQLEKKDYYQGSPPFPEFVKSPQDDYDEYDPY